MPLRINQKMWQSHIHTHTRELDSWYLLLRGQTRKIYRRTRLGISMPITGVCTRGKKKGSILRDNRVCAEFTVKIEIKMIFFYESLVIHNPSECQRKFFFLSLLFTRPNYGIVKYQWTFLMLVTSFKCSFMSMLFFFTCFIFSVRFIAIKSWTPRNKENKTYNICIANIDSLERGT